MECAGHDTGLSVQDAQALRCFMCQQVNLPNSIEVATLELWKFNLHYNFAKQYGNFNARYININVNHKMIHSATNTRRDKTLSKIFVNVA